jgi:hypothetical protein
MDSRLDSLIESVVQVVGGVKIVDILASARVIVDKMALALQVGPSATKPSFIHAT